MCKELEEYVKESEIHAFNQGKIEGKREGKNEGKILTYINLIEKGALNVEEAARYADMSVKALKEEAKRFGASLWLAKQKYINCFFSE